MRLNFDFATAVENDHIQSFATPSRDDGVTCDETLLDALRDVITNVRTLVPLTPMACRVTVLSHDVSSVTSNVPLMRRLVELVELASFQIYGVWITQSLLPEDLAGHLEILRFVESFQTGIQFLCLTGVSVNDFILTWWIEQVLVRPAFLPRLEVVGIGTSVPLDEAVVLKLIEAFSQSPREELGWLLFRPALPMRHPAEIRYLTRLLQSANENIHFMRHSLARTIGQFAFGVLAPMLPYERPAFRISHEPTLNSGDTPSFIFDEHVLENDGGNVGFSGMSLQQYTQQRHLFNRETIVLTRRAYCAR